MQVLLFIWAGLSNGAICPVGALLSYLALQGRQPGPLFLFRDSTPLSSQRLLSRVHLALSSCGHVCTGLTGHSFRIGAATAAARAGVEDSFIQALTGARIPTCAIFELLLRIWRRRLDVWCFPRQVL